MRTIPYNFTGQPAQFTETTETKEETVMAEPTTETKTAPEPKPEAKPETAAPATPPAQPQQPAPTMQVNWWWLVIAMVVVAAAVYFFMKSKIPAIPVLNA